MLHPNLDLKSLKCTISMLFASKIYDSKIFVLAPFFDVQMSERILQKAIHRDVRSKNISPNRSALRQYEMGINCYSSFLKLNMN